ncbi:hypothetical protein VB145_20380 [Xanthomonas arboricola]|uniref:hypothetical protein n=1 Tax=Xanthomonas TaxID=338 RepID=UPI001187397E|nr:MULTISPECIES: hypothetical protein [Xanthomonas]MCE4313377.1 hypothetical protein [Xanthomonas hortorum pv. vitians]MCE4535534.1 hypothetical protein [Xanthomonas hortorum pv. vitians]MCE4551123.1 hypothetical protein [Xanthomonas hortorum pv. vitians]MEA5150715.1 hypothetical protein [Xanthomonas arboricola]UQP97934.1 hypothetical protein KP728_21010 [Xanthomonas arboricola pv. juglandis]
MNSFNSNEAEIYIYTDVAAGWKLSFVVFKSHAFAKEGLEKHLRPLVLKEDSWQFDEALISEKERMRIACDRMDRGWSFLDSDRCVLEE